MSLRNSYTAIVERNTQWTGEFATEPYETAWSSEAIFFIRALDKPTVGSIQAHVQISPDGMHWVDEGTSFTLPTKQDEVSFCKINHFGGWLRLYGELPEGEKIIVIVYLVLKE